MIAVDTSALMAIVLNEPEVDDCSAVLESEDTILDFRDCFAYEVAKEHECRLLYVGTDFSKTDIEGAL